MRSLLAFGVAVAALGGASVEARGEWGQAPNGEFWNGCATRFIHALAFGFKGADGAAKYRYEVTDDWHRVHTFEAPTPNASLAPVWEKLPVGYVTVVCRGVERNDDRYHTWVNCMLATARALDNLARAESADVAK